MGSAITHVIQLLIYKCSSVLWNIHSFIYILVFACIFSDWNLNLSCETQLLPSHHFKCGHVSHTCIYFMGPSYIPLAHSHRQNPLYLNAQCARWDLPPAACGAKATQHVSKSFPSQLQETTSNFFYYQSHRGSRKSANITCYKVSQLNTFTTKPNHKAQEMIHQWDNTKISEMSLNYRLFSRPFPKNVLLKMNSNKLE